MRNRGFRRGVAQLVNARFNEGGSSSLISPLQTFSAAGGLTLPGTAAWADVAQRVSATGGVYPTGLPNLAGWWDAGQGLSAGSIASWPDQSGNSRNLLQASSPLQPVFAANEVNGLPSVSFNGTAQTLAASFTLAFPLTYLVVLKMPTPATSLHDIPVDGLTNLTAALAIDNTPQYYLYSGGLVPPTPAAGNPAASAYVAFLLVFNGASSSIWLNGVQKGAGNDSQNRGNPGGVTLGSDGAGARWAQCKIAELVLYSDAKTSVSGDIGNLFTYVQKKYNLY